MASDQEIERLLEAAAQALIGRPLYPTESARLKQAYRSATGGARQRVTRAIDETFNLNEDQRRQKMAASDDADRLMNDLLNAAGQSSSPKKP